MPLNFEDINTVARANLSSLVQSWFPAGQFRGREYVVGGLDGAPGESLSINVQSGRWADFAADAKGGDPISLYAAAFCGDKQGDAARRVAAELGLEGAEPAARAQAVAEAREKAPKPADEIWQPMEPPADALDLPGWMARRASRVWTYRDATGKPCYRVLRIEEDGGGKRFLGATYGRRVWTGEDGRERDETRWHYKHPAEPLPLYGLDRLAANPEAPVIVCEGEKAADAADAGSPLHVGVTWPRGSKNADRADWSPLAGRHVVIWPDADEPGLKAAEVVAGKLAGIAADMVILDVSGEPKGTDAADLPEGADLVAWMGEHQPEPPADFDDSDVPEDAGAPADFDVPGEPVEDEDGVIPLGYDRQHFFYYSKSARQIFDLRANEHGRFNLCAMASTAGYWETIGHLQGEKGVRWPEAADWLMRRCRQVGIFQPSRIRGRGAWIDAGRVVVHLGSHLLVDGHRSPLTLDGSSHLYEAGAPLAANPDTPLRNGEAYRLVELCHFPRWERPVYALLVAGWIALAPICGALEWRPSIWLTGGSGSGKGTVVNKIVIPALGRLAVSLARPTTESGIRRGLRSDALPVILNESERENAKTASEMQAILELMRVASDEGGEVWKADSSGGVARARIRAQFLLQSVNTAMQAQADVSRVTVLALREKPSTQESNRAYEEFCERAAGILTQDFADGLLARSAKLAPVILKNARMFAAVVAETLGRRRAGDQLGALLAGAYSLHSEAEITREQAEAFVDKTDWQETSAGEDPEKDETRLLRTILAAPVRMRGADAPVSRLLEAITERTGEGGDGLPDKREAARLLSEIGLRLGDRFDTPGLYVATNNAGLARILADTAWGAAWSRALSRLPGAVPSSEVKPMRFAAGPTSRATWVPLSSIFDDEEF